jgi:hypothetical protein
MKKPRTLQQAIVHFANPDNCLAFMVERRWPEGVECPTCGSKEVRFISTRRMWECKSQHARKQFSVKVGTIFEDSALPLDKWLVAMWMVSTDFPICSRGNELVGYIPFQTLTPCKGNLAPPCAAESSILLPSFPVASLIPAPLIASALLHQKQGGHPLRGPTNPLLGQLKAVG